MIPSRINFESLDTAKWKALVNSQTGYVPFYDLACLESGIRQEGERGFVIIVLEKNSEYIVALPGREKDGVFSNFFFRTFDNLDLLISPVATQNDIATFVGFIDEKYDGIILRNFNSDSALFRTGNKFLQGPIRKCPYLDLPTDPEEIFPIINKSFKKTLRWNLNGLPKQGITIEVLKGKNIQPVLETEFMPGHEKRMIEKKIQSGFADPFVQSFFQVVNNQPHSETLLTVARQNGTFVGGIYGLCNKNTYAYLASGIRSDIGKFSLGQFLIFSTMEFLVKNNCKRFDFLRGTEFYKSLWTKDYIRNETRYYYKSNSVLNVFRQFLSDNRKRYGRMKCFNLLLQSWFRKSTVS